VDSINLILKKVKKVLVDAYISVFHFFCKNFQTLNRRLFKGFSTDQTNLDKKLVYSLSKSRIPNLRQLKYLKKYLTPKELWIIRVCVFVILISLSTVGVRFYFTHLQVVPIAGGKYIEGLIGSPKLINPLYSNIRDTDGDIGQLVYSSIFKRGVNSELVKDLIADYSVSQDGTIYAFTLRKDVLWHDDVPLTSEDIVFTFNAIKNTEYRSPLKNTFAGVEIQKTNDYKFQFILTDPYAAFLELLTFGILPQHIWSQIPAESAERAELNLKPIGSGPFKFNNFVKDKIGNILEYSLIANNAYYSNVPFINVNFKFFINFEEAINALNNGLIDGISYLPRDLKNNLITPKTINYHKLLLPQLTAIFLNKDNNDALKEKGVRQALALAIDKNFIVNKLIDGDANIVDGPILSNSFAYNSDIKKYNYNTEEANKLLDGAGWENIEITEEEIAELKEKLEESKETEKEKIQKKLDMGAGKWRLKNNKFLIINLKTVERQENKEIIESIKNFWEAVGVKVNSELLAVGSIQAEVIQPRNFDALFYGQIVGSDPDPYAFWHSSQAKQGGFNISNFTNKEVDKLLEDARLNADKNQRQENYKKFQEILAEEVPAIFIYSPIYIYPQNKSIKGFDVASILFPRDRFTNISNWYLKTGKKLIW